MYSFLSIAIIIVLIIITKILDKIRWDIRNISDILELKYKEELDKKSGDKWCPYPQTPNQLY